MNLNHFKKVEDYSQTSDKIGVKVKEFVCNHLYDRVYPIFLAVKARYGEPDVVEPDNWIGYTLSTDNSILFVEFFVTEESPSGKVVIDHFSISGEGKNELLVQSEADEFVKLILEESRKHQGQITKIVKNAPTKFIENPYYLYWGSAKNLLHLAKMFSDASGLDDKEKAERVRFLCIGAFFMFMAAFEGFLNLLYEHYLDDDLRLDDNVQRYLKRADIDLKLRLSPRFCTCFEVPVLEKGEELSRFQSLINLRNDFIHANLVETMRYALHQEYGFEFLVSEEHKGHNRYGLPNKATALNIAYVEDVQEIIEKMIQKVLEAMKPLCRIDANSWQHQYLLPI